ncbi:MAG: DUF4861 domain-containing protein [Sphingobacteriales bacterium]
MKEKYIAIVFSFLPLCLAAQTIFSFKNTSSVDRTDELLMLTKADFSKKGLKLKSGEYVQLRTAEGKDIATQFDDLNGDGIWDELVFLYSFKAGEELKLSATVSESKPLVSAVQRAHVRHMRKLDGTEFGPDLQVDSVPSGQPATDFTKVKLPPFLTEGPAWENDKVGFRLYFDIRNGKDIWGKKTAEMVLDRVGKFDQASYHEEQTWGMDVLKVGKSLGAGALALQVGDSLIRLGGVNMGKIIYQKIADGPIRAIFRLFYPEWRVLENAKPVHVTEEISIWGGQYFSESKVTIRNAPADARIVTGIVNLKSKQVNELKELNAIFTFDKQSENNDLLGMSVMLKPGTIYSSGKTANEGTDITQTYFVSSPVGKKPFIFRFYAGWEKSSKWFTSVSSFKQFLENEGKSWSHAIQYK